MVTLAESEHTVFRVTSPLPRGVLKSKGGGKLSIHFCADQETIKTVFCTITSVNQLSINGAVAAMCEEYESYHDRTGWPVVRGQSCPFFVSSVIKTNMLLNDDLAHAEFLLQRHRDRIEKLSQQDKLSNFLARMPDSWLQLKSDSILWREFTNSVACREYTLSRNEDSSTPYVPCRQQVATSNTGPILLFPLIQPFGSKIGIKCCEQWQFSLVGQNFSWLEQVGHGLDRQEVRRQRTGNRHNDGMVFSLETLLGSQWWHWQFFKDGRNCNPVGDSSQTVPCAFWILRRCWRQRTEAVPSSVSNFHRHRNPRGKQLENLTAPNLEALRRL